jgi:glycosyltransferase involved in cell wall biosynthesis
MNIIIYNINSFGGNYEYSKFIFDAYSKNTNIKNCLLLMPANANFNHQRVFKVLLADLSKSSNVLVKRCYFLYRSLVNPIILFRYLKTQPASVVLFNDYDQTTAFFWSPLFKLLRKKHRFAVVLHDPDRDKFFRYKSLSEATMRAVMSFMDVAFYHGFLPEKKYYSGNVLKVKVPHGIYYSASVDEGFLLKIKALAEGNLLIGVLGNIRAEKNYEIIIDALAKIEGVKLLIAGQAANSSVPISHYKSYAKKRNVDSRIIWIEEYLSSSAFNAAIKICDVILLYYKSTFTSQSGILNTIAPFKKKLIISNAKSSLRESVEKYNLGKIVPEGDARCLVETISNLIACDTGPALGWQQYMDDSSWEKHVSIAVDSYKKIMHEYQNNSWSLS